MISQSFPPTKEEMIPLGLPCLNISVHVEQIFAVVHHKGIDSALLICICCAKLVSFGRKVQLVTV